MARLRRPEPIGHYEACVLPRNILSHLHIFSLGCWLPRGHDSALPGAVVRALGGVGALGTAAGGGVVVPAVVAEEFRRTAESEPPLFYLSQPGTPECHVFTPRAAKASGRVRGPAGRGGGTAGAGWRDPSDPPPARHYESTRRRIQAVPGPVPGAGQTGTRCN